jgi:hypothetical protein
MFSDATLAAMQHDIEVHRRKFGTAGPGAVDWTALWAAVQAIMPTLIALFSGGTLNLLAIPAALANFAAILIALFTCAPVPAPAPIPAPSSPP